MKRNRFSEDVAIVVSIVLMLFCAQSCVEVNCPTVVCPTPEPCATCAPWPTSTPTAAAQPTVTPTPTAIPPTPQVILWDDRLTQLGVTIDYAESADFTISAAWLTVDGNWDDVPIWAKKWQNDTLGGAYNAYGRLEYPDGKPTMGAGFVLSWPGGADQRTPETNGWANIPITAGFDWSATAGPYTWAKYGNADKLVGIGLPYPPLPWQIGEMYALGGVHTSFFVVYEYAD